MHPMLMPQLVNPPFGDPGLYVDFRNEKRALLFDIGDIGALAPRKLLRFARTLRIATGRPVIAESATAVRTSCPPPSP